MKRVEPAVWWGGLLVVGGVLFLLQNLGLASLSQYLWAIALGVVGLLFIGQFARNRGHWWALIPGVILLTVAGLIGLEKLAPAAAGTYSGPLILGGIGLSFFAVYLANRNNWWAIIPGGVMGTLAGVTLGDVYAQAREVTGWDGGGVFFLGLGLTFGLLYLLPTPHGRMRWAVWPALPLLVFGAFLTAGALDLLRWAGPVLLIAGGLLLVFRALRPRTV